MAILALSREQIQIQITHESTTLALVVPHAEDLHIFMPHNVTALTGRCQLGTVVAHDLNKLQPEQLLEDLQHALDSRLQWEVLGNLLLVQRIVLLQQKTVVEPVVPEVIPTVKRFTPGLEIGLLHLQEVLDLLLSAGRQTRPQVSQEVVDRLRSLGHLVFHAEGSVVGVPKQTSGLVP